MKPKFKTPTLVSPPSQTIELTSERFRANPFSCIRTVRAGRKKDGRDLEDWLQAESETAQANLEISCIESLPQRGISRAGMASRTRLKEGNRAFWPYVALAISIIGPG